MGREIADEPVNGRVRAKIACISGWISTRMADGSQEFVTSVSTVVRASLPITASRDCCSTELAKLCMGTNILMLETADEPVDGQVRAKIACPSGWVSIRMAAADH